MFCLVLHQVVIIILQEVPTLRLNEWYLDDGTQIGCREDLQMVVDIILREGPARGLHLSCGATVHPPAQPKSTVWCPAGNVEEGDPLERGIARVRDNGIVLLGSPVGDSQFVSESIDTRIQKVKTITDKLQHLQDAQTEFCLLRSCLSIPKVMYMLRTTDPTQQHPR